MRSLDPAREEELVTQAQRGDRGALDALMHHHASALLFGVVLPRVRHREDAEDIVRESIARAVERLPTFVYRRETGLFPWLRTIAERLVVDRGRRAQVQAIGEARYGRELETTAATSEDHEASVIEVEEHLEKRARLDEGLAALNERYRRVITLRLLEERPRDECAATLGVTLPHFDVLLHRAITALKKNVEAERLATKNED